MAVVKINAIEVPEGAGPELERRFAARRGQVEGSPGFLEFQLLRPVAGESRYFVYTKWESEEAFQAWSAGAGRAAHAGPSGPAGSSGAGDAGSAGERARPVATGASLLEFEVVQSAEPRG
jgi:heme-degrading monooxygenase HmoA